MHSDSPKPDVSCFSYNVLPFFLVAVFLLIGVTQILYGTATFLYTTIFLRQQMCMSRIASFGICSFAILHLFLWIFAVAVFQSIDDDDNDSDDLDDVDKNREKRFKQFKKV